VKAIRRAIYAKLNGDATLTALLSAATAIYEAKAPQSAAFPLVIFDLYAPGADAYTYSGRAYEDDLWIVRGVDKSGSSDTVDDIAARIDALLTDGALTISGRTQLYLRRERKVKYTEPDGDIDYRYAGGIFRLWTKET